MHLGGGLCDITNFRTLCTICHARVTKEQATRRAQMRAAGNTRTITALFSSQNDSIAARRAEQAAQDGDTGGHGESRDAGAADGGTGSGRSKRKAGALLDALAKGAATRLATGRRRGNAGGQKRRRGGGAVQATLSHGGGLQLGRPKKGPGRQGGDAHASSGAGVTVDLVDSDSDFETDGGKLLRKPARGEHALAASPSASPCAGGDAAAGQGLKEKAGGS